MMPYFEEKGVVLYQADCLEAMRLIPDASIDACITDAPYGIGDTPFVGVPREGRRVGESNVWHPASEWDKAINPAWCRAICEAAPIIAWFGHWRKREEVERAMRHPLRAEIVWAKDCHVGPPCPLAMRDERIWIFGKGGIEGRAFETTVWDEPIIPTWSYKHHKNEKPIALMRRLIRFLTDPGDVVIDPFMGSGTTGVACVIEGRGFIGIEQDAHYCEVSAARIKRAQGVACDIPKRIKQYAPTPLFEAVA